MIGRAAYLVAIGLAGLALAARRFRAILAP